MSGGQGEPVYCTVTVGKAQTPSDSDEDVQPHICDEMPIHEPENDDSDLPRPQNEDNDRPQIGRQKAVAAVSRVHPPELIAKLINLFIEKIDQSESDSVFLRMFAATTSWNCI